MRSERDEASPSPKIIEQAIPTIMIRSFIVRPNAHYQRWGQPPTAPKVELS